MVPTQDRMIGAAQSAIDIAALLLFLDEAVTPKKEAVDIRSRGKNHTYIFRKTYKIRK